MSWIFPSEFIFFCEEIASSCYCIEDVNIKENLFHFAYSSLRNTPKVIGYPQLISTSTGLVAEQLLIHKHCTYRASQRKVSSFGELRNRKYLGDIQTKMSTCQLKANLDVTILLREITRLLNPEIRNLAMGVCMGMGIPRLILLHDYCHWNLDSI